MNSPTTAFSNPKSKTQNLNAGTLNPTSATPHPTSNLRPPTADTRQPTTPPLLALFQKRIEGDDALLRLASLRFREAGLGAEFYAESRAELEWLLGFWPSTEQPVVVHLNRQLNVLAKAGRDLILDFATSFSGKLYGLVIHDQPELATDQDQVVEALREMGARLEQTPKSPLLFLEYAAGLDPALFVETLESLRDSARVSGCLDVGHLGLWQVRKAFARLHPGVDVCRLTPEDPDLPLLIDDLQGSIESAMELVLQVLHATAPLGKPLHFHLHDGHPLSTASPLGVSDHLSFLDELPIPFDYRGRCALPLMFGPSGLAALVSASLRVPGADKVTFSLEIHPAEGCLPLGSASPLFLHWLDKTNAERMNYWLSVLLHNHQLLKTFCHLDLSR